MMNIMQITPKLPPIMDGIGDYGMKLADGLLEYDIFTHFLTCQQEIKPVKPIHKFPVIQLSTKNSRDFLDLVPQDIDKIVLHYSDYPYDAKYGAPFWLLKALETIKQQRQVQLLVMFHEFPSFYLLKRNFYLFPFQSFVSWRLAQIADIIFTNNSVYQTTLGRRLPKPITSIPVFSNIGEPNYLPLLKERNRRMVIFGTGGRRARIYQKSLDMLVKTCHLLEVQEIYDIGPSLNLGISEMKGIPLVEMGEVPAEDVSHLMLDSLAGIAYSTNNKSLAKSGVFATYCAHGVVPIITKHESALADGLEAGTHFLSTENQSKTLNMDFLQFIADNANKWYANHSQAKTVEVFASQLLHDLL